MIDGQPFSNFEFTRNFFNSIDGLTASEPEPLWYTTPAELDLVVLRDRSGREVELLISLCNRLGLDWNAGNIDGMKSSINNYILNQIDADFFTLDSQAVKSKFQIAFKRLCEANSYLRDRPGTYQTHWAAVLENHVKLIASYSELIERTLKLEPISSESGNNKKLPPLPNELKAKAKKKR